MATNPIKYTSRDYTSILADINKDPILADKPSWWKRAVAGMGDTISMWLNAQGNNQFLETAFTRDAVRKLVEMIDYTLRPVMAASGELVFNLEDTVSFPISFARDELVGSTGGSVAVSAKSFEARSGEAVSASSETFTANASTDELTISGDYVTGQKVRVSSSGTLPGGLSASTSYYAAQVTSSTIKLAESVADAFNGVVVDITSTGSGNHTIEKYSFTKAVYQQEAVDQYVAYEGNGIEEWVEVDLRHSSILYDTIIVTISGEVWTRVDSFLDYTGTDKIYKFLNRTDGAGYLLFGNGVYGAILPNAEVGVSYATGGGSDSNISTLNSITVYSGGSASVEGVTNAEAMNGGSDIENIETARRLAPILLKSRDRFVTALDGIALAEKYGGLSQVSIIPNAFGVLSAKVIAIANGGGNPSSSLKTNLQTYLVEKTLLEAMDIRVLDATITTYSVTCDVKLVEGYIWSITSKYVELAWKMFFTDAGEELRKEYNNNGTTTAITFINSKWGYTFDENDYDSITPLLQSYLKGTFAPRLFGKDVYSSDALSFVAGLVSGVDYIQVTSPSFPITLASDEITTDGTITLNEVT